MAAAKETPKSPASQAERTEARRQEIVAEAVLLFDRDGYAGTSVEDIADALGISKPALYHYIDRKEDILFWIHDAFAKLLIENLEARLSEDRTMREQLECVVSDVLALMTTHREYIRVFFEHFRELDEERQSGIKAMRDRYQRLVEGIIERGIAGGEFRVINAQLATMTMFGACNWAYQWYREKGPLSNQAVAAVISDVLLEGMAAR